MVLKSSKVGIYTDENNVSRRLTNRNAVWRNSDLWEIIDIDYNNSAKLSRLSDEKVITVNWDELNIYFEVQHSVNNHKVQGDTIKNKNILVYLDDFLFHRADTLLRHLYVAISRAQNSGQIRFLKSQVERITQTKGNPLTHNFKIDENSDSSILTKNKDNSCYILKGNILDGYVGTIYSTNITQKGNILSPFGLGLSSDKELMRPATWNNRKALHKFRENLDIKLSNRKLHELPEKGLCFITKNECGVTHKQEDLKELNWFVFESDELSLEEQHKILEKNKKLIYRAIYSGNNSIHLWIYVKNAPKDIETYRKMAKKINEVYFDNKMCQSCINPAQLMRAPNIENAKTGKTQELIFIKRNIIEFDYSFLEDEQEVISVLGNTYNNEVQFYFDMAKDDHDGTDGGRGKLILRKANAQKSRNWSNEQCKELIKLLCIEWNCKEKISGLQSYFN